MDLDNIDKKILDLLQKDSKMSINEMSNHLKLTKTPIYERIKRLEKSGVIEKYVAVLDKDLLKHSMVVFCSVSLESQKIEAIKSFSESIEPIPEVMECYLMGGSNDFLLKVLVKDLHAYHIFSTGKLASLPYVSQIKSTFVLNEVKHTNAIPFS